MLMEEEAERLNDLKKEAAEAAVTLLKDGMVVGLGSGSTATLAVKAIGTRVKQGLNIIGIPTSEQTAQLARELGIPLSSLDEHEQIDVTIDGADEVELGTLNLIKGRGGALLREKIVASSSAQMIVVVDESKLVDQLAVRDPVPAEVVQFGWPTTARRLRQLGAAVSPRMTPEGKLFVTDGGHYILDCLFGGKRPAAELQRNLDSVVGVVEHGLFLGIATEVIVGAAGGMRWLKCSNSR
jgi:ribose 5-phosphate isomerase A